MTYLEFNKGWMNNEFIIGLLIKIEVMDLQAELLYMISNSIQTYQLIFKIPDNKAQEFITNIPNNIVGKCRIEIIKKKDV
jgi:hypothetical protein